MVNTDAFFDTLVLIDRISQRIGTVVGPEVHLFAYLACLLAVYRGWPSADWGYRFACTDNGALEIMESCKILRQALTTLPPGELNAGEDKLVFTTGTATSRVEAPRGEVMYSVSWKEGSNKPARVHVRTPTFVNMPAIRSMVQGARLADTPLIQASIDPCYSCTDR